MKEGIHVIFGPWCAWKKHICNLYIKDGWIFFHYYPNCYPFPPKKRKHLHKNQDNHWNPWNPSMIPPSPPVTIFSAEGFPWPSVSWIPAVRQIWLVSLPAVANRTSPAVSCLGKSLGKDCFTMSSTWEDVEEERYGTCKGCLKLLHRLPCTLW